jgi:hypothetical protein
MNREEILDVLIGRSGGACPDRGVRADDILLGRYAEVSATNRPAFWQAFGEALLSLWQLGNTEAVECASAFVAGLDKVDRTDGDVAFSVAGFLLEDSVVRGDVIAKDDSRRRVVAALRMLANLGLGTRTWWRCRFFAWLHDTKSSGGEEGQLAWQAVLHSSLGLMNCCEPMPNIDAWLEDARIAKEFPAIELFTLLARQTEYQQDKMYLKNEVIEAYQSLYVNCNGRDSCSQGIEDIRSVIETWLVDRLHLSPSEAHELLKWRQPDKRLPQDRIFRSDRQSPVVAVHP